MGLPASQRRSLEQIEFALRSSDPWLASLFTIFGRLHPDEALPPVEQLRVRAARLSAAWRWLTSARRARLRSALLLPAALAALVSAVLVSAGFPSSSRCGPAHRTPRVAPVSRQVRCPHTVAYPVYLSR
jgi:hypothetical protein